MTAGPAAAGRLGQADWLPQSPADLFGLDPADPPRLPLRAAAPVGVTVIVPTCPDPASRRQASLLASLRSVTSSAERSGLPIAVLVAADGLAPEEVTRIARAVARLGCPAEVLTTDPPPAVTVPAGGVPAGGVPAGGVQGGPVRSAARTRNHALGYLAALGTRSPLRLRYLLFLDDDSAIAPGGAQAMVRALESAPAAIAACPAVVPVPSLEAWHPVAPVRPVGTRLPGPWRGRHYDLLSVTSHGSLVTGRVVGLVVRAEPVLAWVASGGRMFCPATPRGSTEDMLAMAALAALGTLLAVPQVQAADLVRGTPAATRSQQLRWGYDHAWLVRALTRIGLLPTGVRGLVWCPRRGWEEILAEGGVTGVLVNPAQLTVLSGVLSAIAADSETAVAVAGADAGDLAAAAAALARTLDWWRAAATAGPRRLRPDLPGRMPDDWADLRHGLDSRLAHVAGNALGSLRSGLGAAGLPRHLLFGTRQRAVGPASGVAHHTAGRSEGP